MRARSEGGKTSPASAGEFAAVAFGRCFLVRVRGDLEPAVQRQLFQNVVHVTLHGVGRDVEPLGDFFVAQALGDEVGDLLLAQSRDRAPRADAG